MKKFLLLLPLLLTSCGETPFPRCIAADDFFGMNLSISAQVPKGSSMFKSDDCNSGQADCSTNGIFDPNQVIRWTDTGYVTNGDELIIRTEGKWTSWLDSGGQQVVSDNPGGGSIDTQDDFENESNLSSVPKTRICGPYLKKDPIIAGCSQARQCPYVEIGEPYDDANADQYGPPCWFTNGYGAYILLQRPGDPDPNQTLELMRYPQSPVVHIGYDVGSGEMEYSSSDHPIIDSSCNIIRIEKGWKIYARILDRFYWDNAGGYSLAFIKGVINPEKKHILEDIRKEVETLLIDGAEHMFKQITSNNIYVDFVRYLLVLYIVFTGIAYVIGMIQQPISDIMLRLVKVGIIMQFISPYAWEFFYNNIAILFVEGTAQMIAIINAHSGVEFDPDAPFAVFDRMLDLFFSDVIWRRRMPAFIWTYPPVIVCLVLLVIIIILLAYTIVMIYACIIYLTSMIGITILISLMPILFLSLLFTKIPNTFENWFKQAMSFAFQSIMVFTLVSLFSAMIVSFFYRTFGYTVCYNKTVDIKFCLFSSDVCVSIAEISSWTFGSYFDHYLFGFLAYDLSVKKRITFVNGAAVIKVPPEYEITDYRYIDYPYLDPNPNSFTPGANDAKNKPIEGSGRDYEKITNGIQGKEEFVSFDELFTLVLLTVLLWHLRLFVQRLGALIAGASPFINVIGYQYSNFFQPNSSNIAGKLGKVISGLMFQAGQTLNLHSVVTSAPEKIIRIIPGGGKFVDFAKESTSGIGSMGQTLFNIGEWVVGGESDIKRELREKEAFKWIHYGQAVMGQTLSNISPDNLFVSGLSYGHNKLIGKTDESLGGHIKLSYLQQLEKLKDNIIGYKRPGVPDHKDDYEKSKPKVIGDSKKIFHDSNGETGSNASDYDYDSGRIADEVIGEEDMSPIDVSDRGGIALHEEGNQDGHHNILTTTKSEGEEKPYVNREEQDYDVQRAVPDGGERNSSNVQDEYQQDSDAKYDINFPTEDVNETTIETEDSTQRNIEEGVHYGSVAEVVEDTIVEVEEEAVGSTNITSGKETLGNSEREVPKDLGSRSFLVQDMCEGAAAEYDLDTSEEAKRVEDTVKEVPEYDLQERNRLQTDKQDAETDRSLPSTGNIGDVEVKPEDILEDDRSNKIRGGQSQSEAAAKEDSLMQTEAQTTEEKAEFIDNYNQVIDKAQWEQVEVENNSTDMTTSGLTVDKEQDESPEDGKKEVSVDKDDLYDLKDKDSVTRAEILGVNREADRDFDVSKSVDTTDAITEQQQKTRKDAGTNLFGALGTQQQAGILGGEGLKKKKEQKSQTKSGNNKKEPDRKKKTSGKKKDGKIFDGLSGQWLTPEQLEAKEELMKQQKSISRKNTWWDFVEKEDDSETKMGSDYKQKPSQEDLTREQKVSEEQDKIGAKKKQDSKNERQDSINKTKGG